MMSNYYLRNNCRLCSSKDQNLVLSLKPTAICDAYVSTKKLNLIQEIFPLDLYKCNKCGNLQISCIIDPDTIYENYIYKSISSTDLFNHFAMYANTVIKKVKLARDSLIIDIGSNDGILLKHFKNGGMRVLGIEPAGDIVKEALNNDVETIHAYFNSEFAEKIIKDYGFADLVTVNNLFANIDDLGDFVIGIKNILKNEGVLVIEASNVFDMIENMVFDYIYHEHLSYFSLKPLKLFFNSLGLEIFDVEKILTKGGSMRIFVQSINGPRLIKDSVNSLINHESSMGLYDANFWNDFNDKINLTGSLLRKKLSELVKKGYTIAGYGGSATSTTLIYHFGLNEFISYIFDDNPDKQNTFSPGFHIPVLSPKLIYDKNPDYIILLAWRFEQVIIKKHKKYLNENGHFILPLPALKII
jgi:SAM-dependent methyltransferase